MNQIGKARGGSKYFAPIGIGQQTPPPPTISQRLAAAGGGPVNELTEDELKALRTAPRKLGRKGRIGLAAGGLLIPAAVAGEAYRRRRQDVGKSELAHLGYVSKAALQDKERRDTYGRNTALAGGAGYLVGAGAIRRGLRQTAAELTRHGVEVSPQQLRYSPLAHTQANKLYRTSTGRSLPGTGKVAGGRLLRAGGGALALIGTGAMIQNSRNRKRQSAA